jgi:exosome complex component RRP43
MRLSRPPSFRGYILVHTSRDFYPKTCDQTVESSMHGETFHSILVRRCVARIAGLVTSRTSASISTADGSALVRLGKTTIVCGVKAETAPPDLDAPEAGFLGTPFPHEVSDSETILLSKKVPNLDLPALSSSKFKPGPPGEDAQVLSERLNQALVRCVATLLLIGYLIIFRSSGIISPSSLCIHPGKVVWVLYVDAVCINYDGNAFDATLIAMVAALKNSNSILF